MHPLFYYLIFSYPIIAGVLWESDSRDFWIKLLVWVVSPLLLPVLIGMIIQKYYNK